MPVSRFRSLPVFRPDPDLKIGAFTLGEDAFRLARAILTIPNRAADEAAQALGDPASRVRRAKALQILEAMPARQQEKILDAYYRAKRNPGAAA